MIRQTINGVQYDILLGGPETPVLTQNVMIASGENLKRGALMKKDTDKYSQVGTGDEAVAVLADDVDATSKDTMATVYIQGRFHREGLSVKSGDTVAAHEDELRKLGMYVTSIKK
ncbi:head decoration protein [Veillonella magna]|uniref:head decoration protein n=1 Tax=Veillonella magna TaxID=464322 RepID=UPI0023F54C36|nr:head decoration protein [Veillonella magna]